jgi:hypothetical protein
MSILPLVIFLHVSNPLDGGVSDTTTDFLGAGVAVEWRSVEVEAAAGVRAIRCSYLRGGSCPTDPGAYLSIKWKPRLR